MALDPEQTAQPAQPAQPSQTEQQEQTDPNPGEGSHVSGQSQDAPVNPLQGTHLEVDLQHETDSAIGDEDDDQSITTSLASSIRDYRIEHGRTYHQYKDGHYAYPNDEAEKDRLDLQHHLYLLTLDQKLYLSPIKDDVQNVLDIGTGTGLWAIEFADAHPSAVVIGTELSPMQPNFFIIDDANEPWVFKKKFDFIHSRQLHCAVEEKNMMRQAFENLNPGGWLEMQELSLPVANDDNTMTPDHAVYQWTYHILEASNRVGQSFENPPKYSEWMREAGFVNVQHVVYKWPTNPWPKDKKHKTLGLWTLANLLEGLEGFSMALFTRVLGWQPEEVQTFLVGVRNDVKNQQIHNYYNVHVVFGQKPE